MATGGHFEKHARFAPWEPYVVNSIDEYVFNILRSIKSFLVSYFVSVIKFKMAASGHIGFCKYWFLF